jgi:hypothetical protein
MKTKMTIKSLLTLASMTVLGTSATIAQQNLGAACGCPSTTSRTTQTIQSLAQANGVWTNLAASAYGGEITGNLTLTCDKIWTIDQKIYVASGATLTIEPGTLIKGTVAPSLAAATALIIERGGKIMAPGTESCPIVFTAAADNLSGSYGVANKGQWGGVLLLGKATNNLKIATNGPFVPGQGGKMAVADGLGVIEGFASSYPQDQFGVATSIPVGTVLSTSPSGSYTFGLTAGAAVSGSNASGQNKLTLSSSASPLAYVVQGQTVSGTGVAAGSTILSIAQTGSGPYTTTLTLSDNLTAAVTAGNAITFGGDYPNPGATGYFSSMTYVAPASGAAPTSGTSGTVASYVGAYYTSTGSFDDNDNSGVMTYVSIRHSGANLLVGSEINGLTLASVGRGTKIEHIEIVSCADDNIEIFGGTVNLKYCTTLFGNDDMFDYDLGWTGKAQFFYGMKADQGGTGNVSVDNDNGIEADSDDNSNNATPRSHPIMYNFTLMGNSKAAVTADNRSVSGANFKDGAEGELYNSVIAGFRNGINIEKGISAPRTFNAYQNWTTEVAQQDPDANTESLKIKCNTLIGNTFAMGTNAGSTATVTGLKAIEKAQFTTDKNDSLTSLTGFSSAFAINGNTNANITKNDPVPTTALSITGCPTPPSDGFFEPAPYRGAFSSTLGQNWLSDWSYSQVLGQTLGIKACPTDLDKDGDTDIDDFTIFAPAFGLSCD